MISNVNYRINLNLSVGTREYRGRKSVVELLLVFNHI